MRGETIAPLIDLAKIDRVPISLVIGAKDLLACPVPFSEQYFNQITSAEKYIRFERGGHL